MSRPSSARSNAGKSTTSRTCSTLMEDEWRRALEAAMAPHNDEGMTVREIAEAMRTAKTQWRLDKIRDALRDADKRGDLIVGKATRRKLGGQATVNVYRLRGKHDSAE